MGSTFIQSVDRAFKIIEYISDNSSAGVSELARNLDINKSTVFGLIKTLEQLGYVKKNDVDDKYFMSYKFYSLVDSSIHNVSIIDVIRPYSEILNKKYGETVHLVTATGKSVIYIDKIDGTKSIRVSTRIGSKMPLHCTGVGKAILALRTDEEIEKYIDTYGLKPYTKNTITDKDKFMEEIEKIRRNGYSIDNEEIQEDLYCIAIATKYGNEEYALSLSMPRFRVNEKLRNKIVDDLLTVKEKI